MIPYGIAGEGVGKGKPRASGDDPAQKAKGEKWLA